MQVETGSLRAPNTLKRGKWLERCGRLQYDLRHIAEEEVLGPLGMCKDMNLLNCPEVASTCEVCKGYIRVLSKIMFYLLQDGRKFTSAYSQPDLM